MKNSFSSHFVTSYSIIFDRQTSLNFDALRIFNRFRIENDTSISNKRFADHFRTFNFFFIDSKNEDINHIRNSITTKFFVDSDINSIIIRETSTEKTIYFDLFEFTNNSAFTMFFDFVVQAIIDVSINIIMTKMQQMINQNQSTTVVDSASSQDEREFSEAAVTKTVDTSRFVSKKFDFFNSRYQNKTTAKASALENIDENIIYRDVHVFIFRIKNYFHIYDYQLIRDIFY